VVCPNCGEENPGRFRILRRGPAGRHADARAALARADALYRRQRCTAALKVTAARRAALPD
jgi:hypothetical protein